MGDRARTALVADDERTVRALAEHVLRQAGWEVTCAADGAEAVERFRARPTDLVILDALMPELDGFEACRRLRALPEGAEVPILVATSLDDPESVDRAFEAGATEYLNKPLHWAVLVRRAEHLVRLREIEARLAAERAEAAAAARYYELVQGLPVGVYEAEPEGPLVRVNRAMVELLGYPDEAALLGHDAADLWADPADRARWIDKLRTEGTVEGDELRLRRADGRVLWVAAYARAERNGRGRVTRWRGTVVDVTARHRAERERNEALAELEAALEASPVPTILLGPELRVRRANRLARQLLESLGLPPDTGAVGRIGDRPMEDLLASPPGGGGRHEIAVAGPPQRILEAVARPVPPEGPPGGWVLVLEDVTEERRARVAAARTDRLASLGHMAAGIAHDFNNILTTIVGQADYLCTLGDLPPEARERLQSVEAQSFRAADLVRQILDFARRSEARPQPLELLSFVKELARLFERSFPDHIQVRVDFEPGAYWIDADPAKMQQIVGNLAVNARDAMPQGGTLTFRLRGVSVGPDVCAPPLPGMPPGDYVEMEVADGGCGIPAEHRDRVFEPYFTTKGAQGTGLGLSQVYGLVTQHGGFVDLDSEVGRGTAIRVYLPRRPAPAETRDREDRPPAAASGGGQTVLLVEDDPNVREVMVSMLERAGYRVLAAAEGGEAWALWEAHRAEIRAVVTDLVLPGIDGRELARRAKAYDPDVPVVVVTGYPRGAPGAVTAKEVFDVWLPKPVSVREMTEVMARLLGPGGK
ncbi:MAG: hypothetical protein Kow0092_13970 [Deferrisomatales bacterium]